VRADALVQLCSGRLATDPDHDRATVVVHVDAHTLLAEGSQLEAAHNAEAEGGHVLARDTGQRLLCDARVQVSIDEATGAPRSAPPMPPCRRHEPDHLHDRTDDLPGTGSTPRKEK